MSIVYYVCNMTLAEYESANQQKHCVYITMYTINIWRFAITIACAVVLPNRQIMIQKRAYVLFIYEFPGLRRHSRSDSHSFTLLLTPVGKFVST